MVSAKHFVEKFKFGIVDGQMRVMVVVVLAIKEIACQTEKKAFSTKYKRV